MAEKEMYLILENGKIFCGKSMGAVHDVISEIVFTTSMTGYMETLTDKSYYGQAVVQAFPLIGNYGIITEDCESDAPALSAYIVKERCDRPSNFRSETNLDEYLKKNNIVGIYGIDTRALIKIIRENGVMNGMITDDPQNADPERIKSYKVENAVTNVTCRKTVESGSENGYRVVLMDFGLKENIRRCLEKRNCKVFTVPAETAVEDILALNPDGIMLSNGPGDPKENTQIIKNLHTLLRHKIPTFAICLGHQLLALANGFETEKLHYGHRGSNQPVKNLSNGKIYVTTQNHGYCVKSDTVDKSIADVSFINLNDNTCEGLKYIDVPAFSVQFHPEGCGGPQDTEFLFDEFIELMNNSKNSAQKHI